MNDNSLPRVWLLGVALMQGLCLLVLYRSAESGFWPSESPAWAFPLWTLAIAVPLLLLLSTTRKNVAAVARYVGGFAVLLSLLAVYTGWQGTPFGEFPIGSLAGVFAVTIGLACFKALMYLQQRASRVPLTYQVLFTNSWRNFLVGVLAALFTGIFWLILLLWGRLFQVIGIGFFSQLFTEDWFAIPVLSVAFGLGISLFRDLTRVIDNITQLLHWLIKLLLPLVLMVAVVFLGALPFTGLDLLWGTGSGTSLLLWLLALVLFFTNAVYQDGREVDPYPRFLHRAIYVGIAVMPVVAALAFYGLLLRVLQYGWTIERCWAFAVWAVLTLFAVGYVVGIVRRRDAWTGQLSRVNTAMGLAVAAIMLAANSPLLDFRKISLGSQLERVETGEIELAEFDFWYARQHLARPGYLATEEIKDEIAESDPELLAIIEEPTRRHTGPLVDIDAFWNNVVYRPEPFDVPVELKPVVAGSVARVAEQVPVLIRADLDGDSVDEYVLLMLTQNGFSMAQFFYLEKGGDSVDNGHWRAGNLGVRFNPGERPGREPFLSGEISLTAPRYRNITIGGGKVQPLP